MNILLFWILGSFIFFKVAFDAAFNNDISIIASLLLSVMVGISIFYNSRFYAIQTGKHLARIKFSQTTNFFGKAFLAYLVTALTNIAIGKAIVFGFSKKFNRELGYDLLFNSRYTEETFLFVILVIVPITLHFLIVLLGVHMQSTLLKKEEETK